MAGRRKKGGHGGGEHENSERWLLTYADMITLLTAFFIMLYSMSVMNQQKFQQLAISVRSGFGGTLDHTGKTVMSNGGGPEGMRSIVANSRPRPDSASQRESETRPGPIFPISRSKNSDAARADSDRLDRAYETIHKYIDAHNLQSVMQAQRDERGVIVTIMTDRMLFARGQANLRPEELGLLNEIAGVVNTVPNPVRIEGHTDNLPIHNAQFPSNWELSSRRATEVLRYFASRNVTARRLQVAAYADNAPIAPNDTEAHRARNRRVEIVILKQSG